MERSQGINSLAQWARYMILTTPIHNEVVRRACAVWHLLVTVAYIFMRVNQFFRVKEERGIWNSQGGGWLNLCPLDVIPCSLLEMY